MTGKPTLYYIYPSGPARSIMLILNKFNALDKVDLKEVDLMGGEHRTPEFLAINPFHSVPTLKHGDLCLYESTAIIAYLCDIFGLHGEYGVPTDLLGKYKTINMYNFHNMIAPSHRNLLAPWYASWRDGDAEFDVEMLKAALEKNKANEWKLLDEILARNGGFVTGTAPTAADVIFWVDLWQLVKFDYPEDNYVTFQWYDFEEHPNIQNWLKVVKEGVYAPEISEKTQDFIKWTADKTQNKFRILNKQ